MPGGIIVMLRSNQAIMVPRGMTSKANARGRMVIWSAWQGIKVLAFSFLVMQIQ